MLQSVSFKYGLYTHETHLIEENLLNAFIRRIDDNDCKQWQLKFKCSVVVYNWQDDL